MQAAFFRQDMQLQIHFAGMLKYKMCLDFFLFTTCGSSFTGWSSISFSRFSISSFPSFSICGSPPISIFFSIVWFFQRIPLDTEKMSFELLVQHFLIVLSGFVPFLSVRLTFYCATHQSNKNLFCKNIFDKIVWNILQVLFCKLLSEFSINYNIDWKFKDFDFSVY